VQIKLMLAYLLYKQRKQSSTSILDLISFVSQPRFSSETRFLTPTRDRQKPGFSDNSNIAAEI